MRGALTDATLPVVTRRTWRFPATRFFSASNIRGANIRGEEDIVWSEVDKPGNALDANRLALSL